MSRTNGSDEGAPLGALANLPALAHLRYELQQMVGAAIRVGLVHPSLIVPEFDDVVDNALLESTLVHVRSLIDFLLDIRSPQGDDIRASTFGQPPQLSVDERTELHNVKRSLNKHLVHLTMERTKVDEAWNFRGIVRLVVDLMRRYQQDLPAHSPAANVLAEALDDIDQHAAKALAMQAERGEGSPT